MQESFQSSFCVIPTCRSRTRLTSASLTSSHTVSPRTACRCAAMPLFVSPVRSNGQPIPHASSTDGEALSRAEERKRCTYRELVNSPYGRLLVVGCEVAGRWSEDSLRVVRWASKHKARTAPALLRTSARAAWLNRWWGMLSVAVQSALAGTLLGTAPAMPSMAGRDEVLLLDAWDLMAGSPTDSRLPLRG